MSGRGEGYIYEDEETSILEKDPLHQRKEMVVFVRKHETVNPSFFHHHEHRSIERTHGPHAAWVLSPATELVTTTNNLVIALLTAFSN